MSEPEAWYLIEDINPVPWKASEFGGRAKNGRVIVHKPEVLRDYQQAVKDEFKNYYPDAPVIKDSFIDLTFFFWRKIEVWEAAGERGGRSQIADATNLQKGLEDALQGVLFKNDRQVKRVRSEVMQQEEDTDPAILVRVAYWWGPTPGLDAVRGRLHRTPAVPASNFRPDPGVF